MNFSKTIQLGIGLLVVGIINPAVASDNLICNEKYQQLANKNLPMAETIAEWQGLKADCKDDANYYFALSQYYLQMKQVEQAREVLINARENVRENVWFIDLGFLEADKYEILFQENSDEDQIAKVIARYQELSKSHPEYYGAFSSLSVLYILIDEYEAALGAATRANELYPSYWAYRSATIANYHLGLYNIATRSAKRALDHDSSAKSDIDFMLAIAYTYMRLHDWNAVKGTLEVLLENRPEAKDNHNVIKAADYLHQALNVRLCD